MPDLHTIAVISVVFLIGGVLKGAVGVGLATFCLAVLAVFLDLTTAQALILVPAFLTNIWQASFGGYALPILKRIWPTLTLSVIFVWLSVRHVALMDVSIPTFLLALTLVIYAMSGLFGLKIELSQQKERWLKPAVGIANGTVTGITGSFVVPGVIYLQSLALPRDALIQAMGIHFTVATVALAAAMNDNSLLSPALASLSAMALAPAMLGMAIGQSIRRLLSDQHFRNLCTFSLLLIGIYIGGKTLNQAASTAFGVPVALAVDVSHTEGSERLDEYY